MADGSPRPGHDERGAEDPEDDEGWYDDDAGLFDSDDTFGPGTDDDPDDTLNPDDM